MTLSVTKPPEPAPANRGLTQAEANARLAAEGYNELPRARHRTPLRIVFEVLREPMLALLIAGGVVYLLLGSLAEALVLLAFACLSVGITVVQEARTERVLEALRDLTSPRALVIRGGERLRIAGREVARGDLIVLAEGDRVPADAVLLEATGLSADESLLTGEAVPRRDIELLNLQQGKVIERSGRVVYEEPPALVLLGPDQAGVFSHEGVDHAFTLTLKRAVGVDLTLRGDEGTNGLVVLSGMATLDCQFFEHENQTGTEYLFGTVRCPALIAQLGKGEAIISDDRDGLNQKHPFVAAFTRAVSAIIAPHVKAEQEKLRHLERASTSERTSHMIETLLHQMSQAATHDLGIVLPSASDRNGDGMDASVQTAALRFSTPCYYRKVGHPFRVSLLVDPDQVAADAILTFDLALPETMTIVPLATELPLQDLADRTRIEWTVTTDAPAHGEITVRAGAYWAWCEIVVAENAIGHARSDTAGHARRNRVPRDHGLDMFMGYEFRALPDAAVRLFTMPTSARSSSIHLLPPCSSMSMDVVISAIRPELLLAELFMNLIADELAGRLLEKSGKAGDVAAFHAAKQEIVRKYGSDIHQSFMSR